MPVSVAQGDPFEFITTTQTLNGSTGRSFALNNANWWALASLLATIVTTATAGARNPLLDIFDAQGNQIQQIPVVTTIAASLTSRIAIGSGLPFITQSNTFYAISPYPLIIPPNATFKWLDPANIDVNDTVQFNAIFTQ